MSSVVIRDFRGSWLYLASVDRASNGFAWSADGASARQFATVNAALAAARLATREYRAVCYVRDAAACNIAPKPADAGEPTGVASRTDRTARRAGPSWHDHFERHADAQRAHRGEQSPADAGKGWLPL